MKLTPQLFFKDFFPNCYVCAMADSGGQFEGSIPSAYFVSSIPDMGELQLQMLKRYQELNKQANNIFFTPNGAKTVEGRNSLSNLKQINAWWIDIDIASTKNNGLEGMDDETLQLRDSKKAEILGFVFQKDPWPSLTIETRNGFQLYWLSDGSATIENFTKIGNAIYEEFKLCGADKSVVKVMQLMRIPNFYYFKNGEVGKIKVCETLSTFERYSETRMLEAFPPSSVYDSGQLLSMERKVLKPKYKPILGDPNDIFIRVINMPVSEVLEKISKHWLVNGDEIKLQKQDTDRSNVVVNGKGSPNFVVRSRNHIYSNNANEKGPTIVQYLRWYWPDQDNKIAAGLKEVFNS